MPPTAKTEPSGGEDREANRPSAAIACSVLAALGRPDDLFKVTVRPVAGGRYRVNVLTGPDAVSARIAHSYFVEADDTGAVTGSTPAIQKHY